MRILVLRGGALGDFIVTLPALALLRKRRPDAQVTLVGNLRAAELACARGLIDSAHSQDEARWSLLFGRKRLPRHLHHWLAEFNLVVSYWPDPDACLARTFPVEPGQNFIAWPAKPNRAPAAAHYCEPLQPFALEQQQLWVRLSPVAASVSPNIERPDPIPVARLANGVRPFDVRAHARSHIAVHPGSGSPRKNWPIERWREIIPHLPSPVSIVLGEAELDRPDTVSLVAWAKTQLNIQLLLAPALEELVGHFARCRLFLGHDSGVSHVAAACGAPCVLLFGPTDAAIWAPPVPSVRVIQHGPDLRSISIEEVRRASAAALADQR